MMLVIIRKGFIAKEIKRFPDGNKIVSDDESESELILVDKFRTELILSDRIEKCTDFG